MTNQQNENFLELLEKLDEYTILQQKMTLIGFLQEK